MTGDSSLEKLGGHGEPVGYWPEIVLSRNYQRGMAYIKIEVLISSHVDLSFLLTFESTTHIKVKMQRKNTNSVNFILPKTSGC